MCCAGKAEHRGRGGYSEGVWGKVLDTNWKA